MYLRISWSRAFPPALLALATCAFARLGDSREQAEARYGLPRSEKPPAGGSALLEGAREVTFHYEGWKIRSAFLLAKDGKEYVVREEYYRLNGISQIKDFERDAILEGERSGMTWKSQKYGSLDLDPVKALQKQFGHMLKGQTWVRGDGAAAVHGVGGFPVRLDLPQALKYEAELKAIKEKQAREKVPKF